MLGDHMQVTDAAVIPNSPSACLTMAVEGNTNSSPHDPNQSGIASRPCGSSASCWAPLGMDQRVIVTDKLRSYAAAKRVIMPHVAHRQHRYLNNRAENSHQPTRERERRMRCFKSAGHAQPVRRGARDHRLALPTSTSPAIRC